jgi:hypothetical protein
MTVNMTNLDCSKVKSLTNLFSKLDFEENHQNIIVRNFSTDASIDISDMLTSSETGYIEFLGSKPIGLHKAESVFRDSIYVGDVSVNKLFGAFDIARANSVWAMFCGAQIEGDVSMRNLSFDKLIDARIMFNCADIGNVYIENVNFKRARIDNMFYGLHTNTLILNNVDFSDIMADDISDIFGDCEIESLEIHSNCKWPTLPDYNRCDVIVLLFSQCEICNFSVDKQDTALIEAIKKHDPGIDVSFI